METNAKIKIIAICVVIFLVLWFSAVFVFFVVAGRSAHNRMIRETLACEFNGIVDSVKYDDHYQDGQSNIYPPTVTIKGKAYYLDFWDWGFGYKIHKGDTLVKIKNSYVVKLFKLNGKKYVFGN
jgi:hypothetical protein